MANSRKNMSPGIYFSETEIPYSTQSLGNTTLGVAGETLKGPAFQPILIENWEQFTDYFGGTSTEKFKESGFPKYELPYIAESYLQSSTQLWVSRALGLSGYNAGTAWVIKSVGTKEGSGMAIAVLRSRGVFEKYASSTEKDKCDNPIREYDKLKYFVKDVEITPYTNINLMLDCDITAKETEVTYDVDSTNKGMFTLKVTMSDDSIINYPVSFNAGSKDYILEVLGTKQDKGETALFVEELYDVALEQLILNGKITAIDETIVKFEPSIIKPVGEPVLDFVLFDEYELKKKDLNKRFLDNKGAWACHTDKGVEVVGGTTVGSVYVVKSFVGVDGKVKYFYVATGEKVSEKEQVTYKLDVDGNPVVDGDGNPVVDKVLNTGQIFVLAYSNYFKLVGTKVLPITCDLNNYKEQFRCASTPWFVSEIKGDAKNIDLKKLFRFHTISDGNTANSQVKITVQNVRPEEGTFDVLVRDFNDSDYSPTVLEKYTKCSMLEGSSNYIGLKIGTFDGDFELKSKYVTVEVVANETTFYSVPCGFLGYPIRNFDGVQPNSASATGLKPPFLSYNKYYDEDLKVSKQTFGLSDITGIDLDVFYYKGKAAYINGNLGYTPGFHLDSRLNNEVNGKSEFKVTVDGEEGYKFETVSPNSVGSLGYSPKIGTESDMVGTIYEEIGLRKLSNCPYGGFDGWDVYRGCRSHSDEFRANKYKGEISNGDGSNFTRTFDASSVGLSGNVISSDYYAYLGAIRQLSNPQEMELNIIATPGIDYVNNNALVKEVIDMVEEERGDSIYVVTTPDKPLGVSDSPDLMYTASEAVANLEESDIDSSYVVSYFPWVKYFDKRDNMFINIPITKDVVRNMANMDNRGFPWISIAGMNPGVVNGVNIRKKLNKEEEGILQEGKINFIKSFQREGMRIWGDRNLYSADTPLNRISVRRLMLRLKYLINKGLIGLIFNPMDANIGQTIDGIINGILADVQANRGITDKKVVGDDSAEARDRHERPTKIWIKPTTTLEWIPIEFVITPQGTKW